jgi:thiol:disulfide interchange protein
MAAALTTTKVKPVAVGQPGFMMFFRKTARGALAALIAANCQFAQAADLPQTFSDPSPVADSPSNNSPLSPSPLLQTNSKVLPVNAAFALTSFIEADTSIVLRWEMPPGYYLYQKSLVVEHTGGTPIQLELPAAKTITDEFFGEVAVYYDTLLLRLPFSALDAKPGTTVELLLTYQGCAEALYCYPPAQKALALKLPE